MSASVSPYGTNIHPSQYEVPPQPVNTAYPNIYTGTPHPAERKYGEKIYQAFLLTGLFLALSNSYKVFDNIAFVFTQKQYEFVKEEIGTPTTKGYITIAFLFFIGVMWILTKAQK